MTRARAAELRRHIREGRRDTTPRDVAGGCPWRHLRAVDWIAIVNGDRRGGRLTDAEAIGLKSFVNRQF